MQDDIRAAAAQYYDVNPTIPDDLALYTARLPSTDTAVLELGCGTGRGHCQLNVKTTHLCSKERTLGDFALLRTAVFSPSAHHQIPSRGRHPSAILH